MRKVFSIMSMIVLTLTFITTTSFANTYPTKPITVMCMFGPGGSTDLALRIVAEYASKNGLPMNIINKPGDGAQAGIEALRSRPDGYTLFFASPSFITLAQMKNIGSTIDDFTAIAYVAELYLSFSVRSDANIKFFKEWMELAKADIKKYNYASPGAVNAHKIFITKLLKEQYDSLAVSHVPYQ